MWEGQKKTQGKTRRNGEEKRGENVIGSKLINSVVKKIRKRAKEGSFEKENSKKNDRI